MRRALELLARRTRTEHELRTALAADFSTADVDHAIARLHTLGYLDDAAWATDYVAGQRAQQRAARLLRRELLARGISAADADRAVSGHDDHASALRAALRRLRALRHVDPQRRTRRLRDHLRRRGFSQSAIEFALARLSEASDPTDEANLRPRRRLAH